MSFFVDSKDNVIFVAGGKVVTGIKKASPKQVTEYCKSHRVFYQSVRPEVAKFVSPQQLDAIDKALANPNRNPKLVGFRFDGVMCSATERDQVGVTAVVMAFNDGAIEQTIFRFANGEQLSLNTRNIAKFWLAWSRFRNSFFEVDA